MTVNLRYFAAVAEAAGTPEETVQVPAGTSVGDLRGVLARAHGEDFARQLAISAILVEGVRADDDAEIPGTDVRIDILPPFAGG